MPWTIWSHDLGPTFLLQNMYGSHPFLMAMEPGAAGVMAGLRCQACMLVCGRTLEPGCRTAALSSMRHSPNHRGLIQSSLTACRHQTLAAVSPPSGASQKAWVYICPQTTESTCKLIGMHLNCRGRRALCMCKSTWQRHWQPSRGRGWGGGTSSRRLGACRREGRKVPTASGASGIPFSTHLC